jgi:hypothetical protein
MGVTQIHSSGVCIDRPIKAHVKRVKGGHQMTLPRPLPCQKPSAQRYLLRLGLDLGYHCPALKQLLSEQQFPCRPGLARKIIGRLRMSPQTRSTMLLKTTDIVWVLGLSVKLLPLQTAFCQIALISNIT